ncbi:dihydrolipoamide acetyltransferase family protein [Sphingomonas tabacisoli]|uniref:Dihydrolipoamide acetyltransferase component of pyruvate dehydrogenase complex n=1 Tax=Sphingomonas tabacisoli TaxID=2249466 RepID=A0ABW4HYF2_9SPHN
MARFEFRLPDIGEGIAEAEIVAWHVKVGDRVEEDQQLADMMTDKATVEMESPVAGTVLQLAGEVGDQIPIGSTLVVIETAGEDAGVAEDKAAPMSVETEADLPPSVTPPAVRAEPVEALPSPSAPEKKDQGFDKLSPNGVEEPRSHASVLASPAVRARAKELGIDLSQVKPSQEGRIRHHDLDAFLTYNAGQGYHAPHVSRARADETIKVIGMRRKIAENMQAAKRHIPHFTYVDEIDVTALEDVRADLNANRGQRPKLTMLPFLIVAICRTLPEFPMLNARYDDEAGVVTRSGRVHLGMAAQTDAGLTVPVIRDAQDKNVWQLASEIARLAEAARTQKLKPDELGGGTITVTSLGPLGGIATTPVINRPEVAIIGPNKIVERPVFRGDDIVRAKLMNLSISCDHRVVDGWDAASYVQALKKLLETPVLLFAD